MVYTSDLGNDPLWMWGGVDVYIQADVLSSKCHAVSRGSERDTMSRGTRSVLMIKLTDLSNTTVVKSTKYFYFFWRVTVSSWLQRRLDFLHLSNYENDISGSCESWWSAGESLVISSSADAALMGRFPKHAKMSIIQPFYRPTSQNFLFTVVDLRFSVQAAKQLYSL